MTPIEKIAYDNAVDHLNNLRKIVSGTRSNPELQRMIDEAQARVNQLGGVQASAPAAQTPAGGIEQRLAAIEQGMVGIDQIIRQVAAPALSEAAQAGATLLAAIGEGLTEAQQKFVLEQQHSGKPPTFFVTQDCKDAAAIYVGAWMAHAEQEAKK